MNIRTLKSFGFLSVLSAFGSLLFLTVAQSAEVGFEAGSDFVAVRRGGYLDVTCDGMDEPTPAPVPKTALYYCSQNVLEPVQTSALIGKNDDGSPILADRVKLKVYRADGSTRSRTKDFLHSDGKSDEFTLWNKAELFSWPILGLGKNKVDYSFKNDGDVVLTGSFEVQVSDGGKYECPDERIHSRNSSDCQSQFFVCQEYFKRHVSQSSCVKAR